MSASSQDVASLITDDHVREFRENGAICLRGVIAPEWLQALAAATDRFLEASDSNASLEGDSGRFVGDVNLWPMDDGFRSHVMEGPAHQIARALMKASGVRLFADQIFVKEPGTTTPTPWHQDQPYWPVLGQDVCSVWVPVDPVTVETSGLEYVAGSHLWDKRYTPQDFGTMSVAMLATGDTEQVPDIDARRDEFTLLSWDMEPGDCLVHNSRTVHGSGANKSNTQRRVGPTPRAGSATTPAFDRTSSSRPRCADSRPASPWRVRLFPRYRPFPKNWLSSARSWRNCMPRSTKQSPATDSGLGRAAAQTDASAPAGATSTGMPLS